MAIDKVADVVGNDAQLQAWEYFLKAFAGMGWQSQLILAGLVITVILILVTNLPSSLKRLRGGGTASHADGAGEAPLSQMGGLVRIMSDIIEELGVQMRALRDSVDQHATYSIQAQTALLETVTAVKQLILTLQEQNHIIGTSVMAHHERFADFATTMKRCDACHQAHGLGE